MEKTITLDTPLETIKWEDTSLIIGDLIDLNKCVRGDDWGQEWDIVLRQGGTVKDLTDELYS